MYRLLPLPVLLFLVACGSLADPTPPPVTQEEIIFPTPEPFISLETLQDICKGNVIENAQGNLECVPPNTNTEAIVEEAVAQAIAKYLASSQPIMEPSTPVPTATPEPVPEPTPEPIEEPTPGPTPTPLPTPTPTPTPEPEVPPIIPLPRSVEDILKNGGFEQNRITQQWFRAAVLQNLSVSGTVDILRVGFPKCEGEQSLDLNGSAEGAIGQSVRIIPGEYYILRFVTTLHTGIDESSMNVMWNGTLVESIDVDTRACKTYSYLVSSNTSTGTVQFISTSNDNGRGVILDNIRLLEGDRFSTNRSNGRFQGTEITPPDDEIFEESGDAINVALDFSIVDIDGRFFQIEGRILNGSTITSIQIWHSQDEELRSLSCTTERPIGIIRKPPNVGTRYTINEISYEWTYCPEKGTVQENVDQVPYIDVDPKFWLFDGAEFVIEAEFEEESQHLTYSTAESVVLYFFEDNTLISRNFIPF